MNITFYTDNIDPRIPEMQKKVFEKFGRTIEQIKPEVWNGHAGAIDEWINENIDSLGEFDPLIIWDIDCIPLSKDIFRKVGNFFAEDAGIIGIAQKASHIPDSIIYAGPAFIAFTRRVYDALERPKFACTERSDCGGELTHKAREKGIEVRLLYPARVEKPMWQLDGPIMFGKGTTFGNQDIYHAFYSRKGNESMFLNKCEEILKNNQ